MRARMFELAGLREVFQQAMLGGIAWIAAPAPQLAEEMFPPGPGGRPALGESEPAFDAANVLRCGRDLSYLVSGSSNEIGLRWLQTALSVLGDYQVHPVRGVYPYTHIDSTISLIRPGLALLPGRPVPAGQALPGRAGTSLPHLVGHVAAEYQLGGVQDWHVLTTGYEDCNIDLRAGSARVVVKVFTRDRGGLAARTAGLIARARAAGVRHPRLHRDGGGSLVHCYDGHQLIVMDFDPGRSFYDLGRAPAADELAAIITQAARIHALDAHPEFVFDPWAITNLIPMAAAAMELLGALAERQAGNDSPETGYLISLGTAGLRDYLTAS